MKVGRLCGDVIPGKEAGLGEFIPAFEKVDAASFTFQRFDTVVTKDVKGYPQGKLPAYIGAMTAGWL